MFIKSGAIIPMQNAIQNTNEKSDGILELNVWYGKEPNSVVYYEDDGSSYDYQKGVYCKREIRFDPVKGDITLSTVEGSFVSKYNKIKLVFHGFGIIKSFKVNGKKLVPSNNSVSFNNYNKLIKIDF